MTSRYRSVVDVYVLLRRADGHILLMERANTGYAAIWTDPGKMSL